MTATEIFWSQIRSFNQATAPVQLALFVAAVVLTYAKGVYSGVRHDGTMTRCHLSLRSRMPDSSSSR